MNPILALSSLFKRFPVRDALGRARGAVHAVDGVTLAVERGEVLAIVGESGCGKSTLGRLALGLLKPDAGAVEFMGETLGTLAPAELRARRRDMQMIFQDPFASLDPRMTVGDAIAEPLKLHYVVPKGGERQRVEEMLERVGLGAAAARRWPHEFSGGQRQRIAIARALISSPKLVIGDEPVSALDVSVQAQVVNLLADLIREFGLTFVLISHDLGVVRHIADRVAVMYLGRIVELGPTAEVFARPRHPYTRALLAAVPGTGVASTLLEGDPPSPISPPAGCRFHPRCSFAVDACRTSLPLLEDMTPPGAELRREFPGRHYVACLRQAELPPAASLLARDAGGTRLAALQAYFDMAPPAPEPTEVPA